jgi:hypothetical protein
MQTIRLTAADLAPASDVDRLVGQYVGAEHFDRVIRSSATVVRPDGTPLFVYIADALPRALCEVAYDVYRRVPGKTHNRWPSSGGVRSVAIGYLDRSPRLPYCRATHFTGSQPTAFARALPFVAAMDRRYRRHAPDRYAIQRAFSDGVSPDYRIADTAFTTLTINRSVRTPAHRDQGDYGGFAAMAILEGGRFGGGELAFPLYRTAVDLRTGGLLLADVHEVHGNAPIVGEPGEYERISVIAYAREGMSACASVSEEVAHARRVFTRGDRRPSKHVAMVHPPSVVEDVDPACPSCGSEMCERSLSECLSAHYPAFDDIGEVLGPIENIRAERLS